MNSVFRTFLSKSGVPLICKALTYQGFFLLLCKCMYSKTLRMRNVYFYARSLFEHGFLTNSRDKRLQRLAESCISKFCEGVPHCKIEHSLKDMSKPIGVSAYQITSSLLEELERQLPSVEDIQKRIKGVKE